MWTVKRAAVVRLPVAAAYTQWIGLEGLPEWLMDFRGVRHLRYTRYCWSGGAPAQSPDDAEIAVRFSAHRILWSGVSGGRVRTRVLFDGLSAMTTRITVRIQVCDLDDLDGAAAALAAVFAVADEEVCQRLRRFRRLAAQSTATRRRLGRQLRRSATGGSPHLRLVVRRAEVPPPAPQRRAGESPPGPKR
jgi:uncharacterized membrane protein